MNASEMVAAVKISQVWVAVGGDPPKHGRSRAFSRNGDNPGAVSLNDEKGCWFDHRDGVGGGVLDLIQHVLGCNRLSALRWLAKFLGVPMEDHALTPAERREYARKAHRAKQEAASLVLWKDQLVDALTRERDRWWAIYHASLRYLLDVGLDAPLSDIAAELHELAEVQVEIWHRKVTAMASATYPAILPVFRETREKAAA